VTLASALPLPLSPPPPAAPAPVPAHPQLLAFDRGTLPDDVSTAGLNEAEEFALVLVHLLSLMAATCCAALRRDPQLENLRHHNSEEHAPPEVGVGVWSVGWRVPVNICVCVWVEEGYTES
jgi:hypothetical protein